MGAVADTFGIPEASVRALAAGADVLLIGADAGRLPAERLAAMDDDGTLAQAFAPPKGTTPELIARVEQEEGWILGV